MSVIQRVIDELSVTPRLHEVQCAEDAQMLGDTGFTDADQSRDIRGAQLLLQKQVHDLRPGGIGQRAKKGGEMRVRAVIAKRILRSVDQMLVITADTTEFGVIANYHSSSLPSCRFSTYYIVTRQPAKKYPALVYSLQPHPGFPRAAEAQPGEMGMLRLTQCVRVLTATPSM